MLVISTNRYRLRSQESSDTEADIMDGEETARSVMSGGCLSEYSVSPGNITVRVQTTFCR